MGAGHRAACVPGRGALRRVGERARRDPDGGAVLPGGGAHRRGHRAVAGLQPADRPAAHQAAHAGSARDQPVPGRDGSPPAGLGVTQTRPLAEQAPLLAAYLAGVEGDRTPFSVPGHKHRAAGLDTGLGLAADADVPLFGGLDTMKLSGGVLPGAEALAARLWQADWCRFGVGGATQANQALLLAAGRPGDQVIMARSVHRSVFSGLVLAGLRPVWLPPRTDPATALPLGPAPAQLAAAFDAAPGAVAVWVTEPSYLGTVADVAGLAEVAHAHGAPLLVDQAWGAHFGFGPGFPPHALAAGADAMVISAHKMLPAYSQAALVLARSGCLPAGRLEAAFDATNTTSPAGAILASTDGARALLASRGPELLSRLAELVAAARERLTGSCPGLTTPGPADFPAGGFPGGGSADGGSAGGGSADGGSAGGGFDPAKLVIGLAGTGADGTEVEKVLQPHGLPREMADRDTSVATVTVADTAATL